MMSFYDNALNRLYDVHSYCEEKGRLDFAFSRETVMNMVPDERRKMEADFQLMEEEGWIVPFAPCGGFPYSFKLTAEGVRVAEGRLYASVEDFAKLIRNHEQNPDTQEQILSVLKSILDKMDRKESLEPGVLSKLNKYLQDSSWLSSPVSSLLLHYLVG